MIYRLAASCLDVIQGQQLLVRLKTIWQSMRLHACTECCILLQHAVTPGESGHARQSVIVQAIPIRSTSDLQSAAGGGANVHTPFLRAIATGAAAAQSLPRRQFAWTCQAIPLCCVYVVCWCNVTIHCMSSAGRLANQWCTGQPRVMQDADFSRSR
jgi:hypothetical protein